MIRRVLAAVDDSAPALAAADFAIEVAGQVGAELRFVTAPDGRGDPEPILQYVGTLAGRAGVAAETAVVTAPHDPYEALLRAAVDWGADLVVMGRSDRRASGRPYVGSQTEHLLEFSPIPVVVVPEP